MPLQPFCLVGDAYSDRGCGYNILYSVLLLIAIVSCYPLGGTFSGRWRCRQEYFHQHTSPTWGTATLLVICNTKTWHKHLGELSLSSNHILICIQWTKAHFTDTQPFTLCLWPGGLVCVFGLADAILMSWVDEGKSPAVAQVFRLTTYYFVYSHPCLFPSNKMNNILVAFFLFCIMKDRQLLQYYCIQQSFSYPLVSFCIQWLKTYFANTQPFTSCPEVWFVFFASRYISDGLDGLRTISFNDVSMYTSEANRFYQIGSLPYHTSKATRLIFWQIQLDWLLTTLFVSLLFVAVLVL